MGKLRGVVLAGGKSRRFGSNKALAHYGGTTLLEKSITLLNHFDLDPVIITSKENAYTSLACEKLEDVFPECGPLGGIFTALNHLNKPILALTCDMPHITIQTIQYLIDQFQNQPKPCDALVYLGDVVCDLAILPHATENRKIANNVPLLQPFPGIYTPNSLPTLHRQLNSRQFSMQNFLQTLPGCVHLDPPNSCNPSEFLNINYLQDLPKV